MDENEEYISESILKPTVEQIRRREEILQRIALLEKSFKSTNYVGDKSLIEEEIIQLENELRKPIRQKSLRRENKNSKRTCNGRENSMGRKNDTKVNQTNEVIKTTDVKTENLSEGEKNSHGT